MLSHYFRFIFSLLLITSLLAPSFHPIVTYAQTGPDDGSREGPSEPTGEGEGEGPGGTPDPDTDGDGQSDSAEAEASAAAAAEVSSAAAIAGVEVGVSAVNTANDPNAKGGDNVSVNGVSMSVDAAISAIGSIADAQAQGLSQAASTDVPGVDTAATLSAHAQGEQGVVVGSMSGEIGPAGQVANAEAEHAGRASAIGQTFAPLSNTESDSRFNATPATNVQEALNTINAHPSLLNATPLAQQIPQLSINTQTVSINPTPIGNQTVDQTFSTNNQPQANTIDVNSVSFGANISNASTDIAAQPPSDAMFDARFNALNLDELNSQKESLEAEVETRQEAINYTLSLDWGSVTQAERASLESTRAALDAINAQIEALNNPNFATQSLVASTLDKAAATENIAEAIAQAEEAGDVTEVNEQIQDLGRVVDFYDRAIAMAEEAKSRVNDYQPQEAWPSIRDRTDSFPNTSVENLATEMEESVVAQQNTLTDFLGIPAPIAEAIAWGINQVPMANLPSKFSDALSSIERGLISAGVPTDVANTIGEVGDLARDSVIGVAALSNFEDAVNFNHAANVVGPNHPDYQTFSDLSDASRNNGLANLAIDAVSLGVAAGAARSMSRMSGIGDTPTLGRSPTGRASVSEFSTGGRVSAVGRANYTDLSLTGSASARSGTSAARSGSVSVTPTNVSGRATGSLGGRADTTVTYNPGSNTATISQSRYGGTGTVEGRISYDTAPTRSAQVGTRTSDEAAARTAAQTTNNTSAPPNNVVNLPVSNTDNLVGRAGVQPTAPASRPSLRSRAVNTAVAVSQALNVAAVSPANITKNLTGFVEQGILRSADDILGQQVSIVSPGVNRTAITPMSGWANLADEAISVRSVSVIDDAGRISAPTSLNQISPDATVQTVNVVAPTPATDLARGLTDLGEVPANLQAQAGARGYDLNSPQEVVALGIAHEMAGPTRANIVNAYQTNPDFTTLSNGNVSEAASFLNALAGESVNSGRTITEQVAVPSYLTSVTVDGRAFETFRDPTVREALTALVTKLTDGSMATERGLNVVTPVPEANHFLTLDLFNRIMSGRETVHGQWAKSLVGSTRVGEYAQSVIGYIPDEINPTEEGLRAVVQRSPMLTEPTLLNNQPGRLEIVDINPNTVAATQPDIVSPTDQTPAATPASLVNDLADTARGLLSYLADPSTLTRNAAVSRVAAPTQSAPVSPTQPTVNPNDPSQAQFGLHTDTKGVDEKLVNIMRVAAEDFPLRVRLFSGKAGRSSGAHSRGLAADVMIYDEAGRPIGAYQTPQTANIYALFALKAREVQMRMYPELNDRFVWGGAWQGMARGGGGTTYGAADFMDFRVGHSGQNTMNAFKWGDPEKPGSGGWQPGFEHYTEGDFLGIGSRDLTNADFDKLAGFQLTDTQWQTQLAIAGKGGPKGPFNAGLLGHRDLAPKEAPAVIADNTPADDVNVVEVDSTNPTLADTTGNTNPNQQGPSDDVAVVPNNQGPAGFSDPETPRGTPPTGPLTIGSGNTNPGQPQSAIGRISALTLATVMGVVGAVRELFGSPESPATPDDLAENPDTTNNTPGGGQTATNPSDTGDTGGGQTNTGIGDLSVESSATSTPPQAVEVLVQVDADTGQTYFDIAGMYIQGEYYNHSYEHEPDEPEGALNEDEETAPAIILSDDNSQVVYSDGTYAPVILNGVWYELEDDPTYLYTVEIYENGQLVNVADNSSVLPDNFLTDLFGGLFSASSEFNENDVEAVTRAFVDPDSTVPADEYYVYKIYLLDGSVRSTTIPHYTSYRFMTERFGEIGYTGNVLTLLAGSVEIPADNDGALSGIVSTLKDLGLSVVDIFRDNDQNEQLPTDLGGLVPSGDGIITMEDVTAATVLFGVEAKCPAPNSLQTPYLYEIVIAQSAIAGATSEQAFRAVRCGGGDKWDYVEQIANHLETYEGIGVIDRQKLYDLIRFGDFRDVDFANILATDQSQDIETSTSTEALPNEDNSGENEAFKPNLTNTITFEVKAVGSSGNVITDWTDAEGINISSGVQLYFRWNGSDYQQCLPFLNDNGNYSLVVQNRAMITGNTESEGYNVPERNAVYKVECGGQRNNEFGVDFREIEVVVN